MPNTMTRRIVCSLVVLLLLIPSGADAQGPWWRWFWPRKPPTTNSITAASCSSADVQAAIDAAATGYTVNIPACSSTWATGVTITKGIHLKGAGGGSVQGSSTTSATPGSGSCAIGQNCAFTVETNAGDGAVNTWITGWTGGETITARYKADATIYITGTVLSWSAPTLTLTVTAVGGSVAKAAWTFTKEGSTILTQNSANDLIQVAESTARSVEISGIHFKYAYPNTCSPTCGDMIQVSPVTNGKPTLIHDTRCQVTENPGGACMRWASTQGLIYRSYADCYFDWLNMTNALCTGQWVHHTIPGATHPSWTTASTMGDADTTGTKNVYLEDCYVSGLTQTLIDFDDNVRDVVRHCILDNSQLGSHGQETSAGGMRHVELYDNTFLFANLGNDSANINAYFFMRGGTLVMVDNRIVNINSQGYGDKPELKTMLLALRRASASSGVGHDGYACWGNGTSTYSNHGSAGPPYPRQHGYGYVTGSGATDAILGYRGDLEPMYIWSNTNVGTFAISVENDTITCDGTPDSSADYIRSGIEYFNDGTAKPSYTKYTYPHPLRSP